LKGGRPRRFTLAEVAEHRTADDAWTVLDGRVYNLSHYVPFHPGGVPILLAGAGKDSTALFRKYHPWRVPAQLCELCSAVGLLR